MNTKVAENSYGDDYFDELQPGTTLLQGQYVIDAFLNSGGFGMTYLARDSLDRAVVIKECFPASFCCRDDAAVRARSHSHQDDFRSIVRLFVHEARRLSKLSHPNIVGVHQVFEDNETAYMVLDRIEGQDLLDIIDEGKRDLHPDQVRKILLATLDAVAYTHDQGILHRDISPDNILLDATGTPILIDFGAAREKATRASRELSALMVVKDGYSPHEFYVAGSEQGPASDLYSLAATFHHVIVGAPPTSSQIRITAIAAHQDDPYQPLVGQIPGYERAFLAAIDTALNIFPKDRIQNARDWADMIDVDKRVARALARARCDRTMDRTISKLVVETNKAVLAAVAKESAEAERNAAAARLAVEKPKIPEILSLDMDDDWDVGQEDVPGSAAACPGGDVEADHERYAEPEAATSIGQKFLVWRGFRPPSVSRFWRAKKSQAKHLGRAG